MSYQLLSETKPKALKEYRCIWCGEGIRKGEIHIHENSRYDGEFQDHRWHLECADAAKAYFKKEGEEEFDAHQFKRGSAEER